MEDTNQYLFVLVCLGEQGETLFANPLYIGTARGFEINFDESEHNRKIFLTPCRNVDWSRVQIRRYRLDNGMVSDGWSATPVDVEKPVTSRTFSWYQEHYKTIRQETIDQVWQLVADAFKDGVAIFFACYSQPDHQWVKRQVRKRFPQTVEEQHWVAHSVIDETPVGFLRINSEHLR